MEPHVGHLVTPPGCQSQVVLEACQLRPTAGQGVVLDIAHGPFNDPFGFRVPTFASDRQQAEVAAQGQELGMETGTAARAVFDGSFQIVDDQGAGAAAEELQGVHHAAIELGLALRQRELDEHQAAVAEHGHEDRDLAGRGAESDLAALAPVHLHRLGRLVMDLLVDPPARRADGPEIATHEDRAALITVGPAGDFLADAHRREFGTLFHQGVDPGLIRVQETGAGCVGVRRGMVQLQGRGHGPPRAMESARDGPDGELVDLGQAADLCP